MASYQQVTYNGPDGAIIGKGATEKIGFYGAVPVAQRTYSSAVHASSAQATSSAFGATQLATLQEIQNTFIALGWWATA